LIKRKGDAFGAQLEDIIYKSVPNFIFCSDCKLVVNEVGARLGLAKEKKNLHENTEG